MDELPSPPVAPVKSDPLTGDLLANIAAGAAVLAIPFAFIPFVGLAASALALGFILGIALWTRKKRAMIGTGIAALAGLIGITSTFVYFNSVVETGKVATAKLDRMQTEIQSLRARAASAADKSALGGIIDWLDTDNELTPEQANTLGKLGEFFIKDYMSGPKK